MGDDATRQSNADGGDISSGHGKPASPSSPVSDEKAEQMLHSGDQAGAGVKAGGEAVGDASDDEEESDVYAVDAAGNKLTVADVAANEQDPLAEGGHIVGED